MTPFWRRTKDDAGPAQARIAGVIPAAGASARMGAPKALLDAGGRSFVAASVGALVAGGCDPVLVVVAPEQPDVTRRAQAAGAVVVENPEPGEGPITSLRLALSVLAGETAAIAVLPVDHPLVRPETVTSLLEAFRSHEAPLVLPVLDGARGHPAILGKALYPELLDPALEGGARTVVHAHLEEALLLSVDDPGVVTDIDTPEAYRAAFAGRTP